MPPLMKRIRATIIWWQVYAIFIISLAFRLRYIAMVMIDYMLAARYIVTPRDTHVADYYLQKWLPRYIDYFRRCRSSATCWWLLPAAIFSCRLFSLYGYRAYDASRHASPPFFRLQHWYADDAICHYIDATPHAELRCRHFERDAFHYRLIRAAWFAAFTYADFHADATL